MSQTQTSVGRQDETSYIDFAAMRRGSTSSPPGYGAAQGVGESHLPAAIPEEVEEAPRRSSSPPAAAGTGEEPAATQSRGKYPPIVVEKLPNWTHHLATLKGLLGYTPNARAFGTGIRFIPKSGDEFRTVQRYLVEKKREVPDLLFFCYTPAEEMPTKVALRGLPRDTPTEEIRSELEALGLVLRHARTIPPKRGRPGCLFFLELESTPREHLEKLFRTTEFLCLPGVTFEAWRGRKGPAQCHRCQGFGHASANCYRKQRCVRCGEDHPAAECPRPKEEAPSCANCGKAHTANDRRCPAFRKEARKKGIQIPPPLPNKPANIPQVNVKSSKPGVPTTLAPAANPATQRGSAAGGRRRRQRGGRRRRRAQNPGLEQAPTDMEFVIPPPPDFTDDEVVQVATRAYTPYMRYAPSAQPKPARTAGRPRVAQEERRKAEASDLIIRFSQILSDLHQALVTGTDAKAVVTRALRDLVHAL